jgi:N6-L-threonylcarbamoyladenine synthase
VSGPLLLAIESSCDETGIALVEGGRRIQRNVVASQVALHAAAGGIVPEVAARAHLRWIVPVLDEVLDGAGATPADLDGIAVTYGPGLAGSLLVGINMAKALAWVHDLPLIGVNHLEGHVYAAWLLDPGEDEAARPEPIFPLVALVVSGGHTFLAEMRDHLTYRLLGTTVDDAAGEAFDKVGRLLGLGYPGGPALARLAAFGDAAAFTLPRPLLHSGDLDFSFAGLKTAVMTRVQKLGPNVCEQSRADLAAATQQAIVDVLVAKSLRALRDTGLQRLVVAGGVGANALLRQTLDAQAARLGLRVHYPPPALCTDNGAMIALAAALRWQHGLAAADAGAAFDVMPRWPLEAVAVA